MANPVFNRLKTFDITRIAGDSNATTNYAQKGDALYQTGAKDGVYVYDISDPENPVQQVPSPSGQWRTKLPDDLLTVPPTYECRDVMVMGDILFAVSRDIDFAHTNAPGVIMAFDISTPLNPQIIASYEPSGTNMIFRGNTVDITAVAGAGPSTITAAGHGQQVGDFAFQWLNTGPNSTFAFFEVTGVSGDDYTIAEDASAWNVANSKVSRNNKSNNNWYQNMATDGTYIYIASQTFGLSVINPALGTGATTLITGVAGAGPTTITSVAHGHTELDIVNHVGTGVSALDGYHQATNVTANTYDVAANGTGWVSGGTSAKGIALHGVYGPDELNAAFPGITPNINLYPYASLDLFWECSGITISTATTGATAGEHWVSLANHGNGVMLINVNNPALPSDAVWVDADEVGPTDPANYPGTTFLRNRAITTYSRGATPYVLSCSNINNHVDRPERGLQWLDMSDPTVLTTAAWGWVPIAVADNDDPWIGDGDQPLQGIRTFGTTAAIANGQRGIALFDVESDNTANWFYLGLQGTDLEPGTNLYQSYEFIADGKQYAYYANGYAGASPDPTFYVDQIRGLGVTTDYIGNPKPTGTGSGLTISVGPAKSWSMEATGTGSALIYGPVLGTETITAVSAFAVGNAPSSRNLILGTYEATSPSDGTPTGNPLFGEDSITIADDTGLAERTVVLSHSLAAHVGKYLTMAVTSDNSITVESESADIARDAVRNMDGGGVLPTPWVSNDTSSNADLEIWYTVEIPDATEPPTLNTEYVDLINLDTDVVSVNLNVNITGNTSIVVTWEPEIPSGLSETNGLVTGTVTTPTNTAIATVTGLNSIGSVTDSFQWTTLTTGDPTSGILVPIIEP